jgi:hypothetical protein
MHQLFIFIQFWRSIVKIRNVLWLTCLSLVVLPLVPAYSAPLPGICDVLGNAPIGGDIVSSVTGSGAESSINNTAGFASDVQSKVNAVGATLTASSISGSQSVGSNTIEVDAATAQAAYTVISSPVNSDSTAVAALTAALGGGDAAQQLAKSMQGLRGNDGSINPVVLTSAVDSYNNYVKYLMDSTQVTTKPTSELNSFVQGLPVGQKVAQVVLGKLTEATR